jgi:hypothetical protein
MVRTDQWLAESDGAGGEKPESSAEDGRSLLVDQHVDVEQA